MVKTVFSCAAASLNKHNNGNYELFKTLPKRAAYRKENISVWKLCKDYYIYCYKNIIIMSLTGLSRDFVEALVNGTEFKFSYIIDSAREDISKAEQYAKEYGFKLENV